MSEQTWADELQEHRASTRGNGVNITTWCEVCGGRWPCSSRSAADEIARLSARVEELERQLIVQARAHNRVFSDRDKLRTRVEELERQVVSERIEHAQWSGAGSAQRDGLRVALTRCVEALRKTLSFADAGYVPVTHVTEARSALVLAEPLTREETG